MVAITVNGQHHEVSVDGNCGDGFLAPALGIALGSVHPAETAVVVQIACRISNATCPRCEQFSAQVHRH